jgi:predicted DNA-binding ribbon-helix-helix protein
MAEGKARISIPDHGNFPRPADTKPFFRAVNVNGVRKGFRLERSYWSALEKMSDDARMTLGQFVGSVIENHGDSKNLSSVLRVAVTEWQASRLDDLMSKATGESILKGLNACPSPVFVLSGTRQLRGYNAAFLRYVRANFVFDDDHPVTTSLKLQIDISTADLIKRLKETNEAYVTIGFVIGMDNRRVRGRINATLAASWDEELIVGYVVS